jgi:alkanesulfonate monooxygenase SsuD/methylene tetrahydromethanopterin reductase-like flavin-dependent oxidoreductase (luciferase family)
VPLMVRQGGDSASPSLPVWLGGFTTPALRRAVRSGDGFTVLGANREPYDRNVAELKKGYRCTGGIRFVSGFWFLTPQ